MEEVRELKNYEIGEYYYFGDLFQIFKNDDNKLTVNSNNFLHNINDNPAWIHYHTHDRFIESEWWFNHGLEHRLTGPATIFYGKEGEITTKGYWIEGKYLDQEQWELESNRVNILNDL